MEKILIINPFGIGDVLFTTPLIRALKEKYPDCFIGYWCNERVRDLLKTEPIIDKIFPLSRGDIKRVYKGLKRFAVLLDLIWGIRRNRFDIAFDFSLDSRYGLWSKLAGIKRRIGFNYKGRGRFLTDKVDLEGYFDRHVVDYYFDLLKLIDSSSAPLRVRYCYSINVSKDNSVKARKALAEAGIKPSDLVVGIAMGGGASWGRDAVYKQWPAEKFGQLAGRLVNECGAHVVLMGSADEKPLADIVMGKMGQSPLGTVPIFPSRPRNDSANIVDLTGKLSLEELAATIKELKLLICNDGGPLHMAVALGVDTVSIFGPVDERVYGPYPLSEKHIVVKNDISCRPCYKNFRFIGCDYNRRCLEGISVDEVYERVKGLLRPRRFASQSEATGTRNDKS